jgi:hypothetical protein
LIERILFIILLLKGLVFEAYLIKFWIILCLKTILVHSSSFKLALIFLNASASSFLICAWTAIGLGLAATGGAVTGAPGGPGVVAGAVGEPKPTIGGSPVAVLPPGRGGNPAGTGGGVVLPGTGGGEFALETAGVNPVGGRGVVVGGETRAKLSIFE